MRMFLEKKAASFREGAARFTPIMSRAEVLSTGPARSCRRAAIVRPGVTVQRGPGNPCLCKQIGNVCGDNDFLTSGPTTFVYY